MQYRKPKLIFVGGFSEVGGSVQPGGQITSSNILLSSKFSDQFNIFKIDTTGRTFPAESFVLRISKAMKRLILFTWLVFTKRPAAALIFASFGLGIYEKLLMCLIAKYLGIRSLLSIRSGHFLQTVQYAKSDTVYRLLLKIPHVLICQGPAWSKFYVSLGVPPDKCAVIPNMINPEKYAECRTTQPLGRDLVFLFVGNIEKAKGISELLEAINIVKQKLTNARWIFVGHGPLEEEIQAFKARHDLNSRIELSGWKLGENLLNYYRIANVFVLPTHLEGFPNVILEAMSSGLPVITTPVGAIPGLLSDRHNVHFVRKKSAADIARAMLDLANDHAQREKYARAAIRHVSDYHSVSIVWPKLADLINNKSG